MALRLVVVVLAIISFGTAAGGVLQITLSWLGVKESPVLRRGQGSDRTSIQRRELVALEDFLERGKLRRFLRPEIPP